MSVTISGADLARLDRAARLLASPLDFETADAWRRSVNRELVQLLSADSAGFALPVSDGAFFYSDEHDPAEIAKYPDFPPPDHADGTPLWLRMFQERVGWLPALYGDEGRAYYASAYYNEYAGANRASDTMFAMMPVPAGEGMAGLHLWHERPDRRRFSAREVGMLRLLYPALRAGIHAYLTYSTQRQSLASSMDALEQACVVCDHGGRQVHRTAAVGAMLEGDAHRELVEAAIVELARRLRPRVRPADDVPAAARDASLVREVRTPRGRYVLRATQFGSTISGAPTAILVALQRFEAPQPLSDDALRSRYGLTEAEVTVARLLGAGRSNAEIAAERRTSVHTTRHQVERVLQKLGVPNRASVAAKLNA